MRPKACEQDQKNLQLNLWQTPLKSFISHDHPLVRLATAIDWAKFDLAFGESFKSNRGRPAIPTRVIVGLSYLKYVEDLSDEEVVTRFLENPYWQYFCGYEFFQTEPPCDSTTLNKWRKRIGEDGAEKMLQETLACAYKLGLLKATQLSEVYVDTTVQEKNITYPTDAKTLGRLQQKLVKLGKQEGVRFKQTYDRECKELQFKISRYLHARQFRRAQASLKRLHRRVLKLYRVIQSQLPNASDRLKELLRLARQILIPSEHNPMKVYSLHEPQVECISKGKARVRYEFGNKVSLAVTAQGNWILGALGFHGNPYDGVTLKPALDQVTRLTGAKIKTVCVDKGYRGKAYHPPGVQVLISGRRLISPSLKKLLKSRPKIEPVIGHLKAEHRLGRNYLAGVLGDRVNPILAAAAFNLRKIMRSFFLSFCIRAIDQILEAIFFQKHTRFS